MAHKKSHCQSTHCPVACALDLIGDHWTLLIIRDLLMWNRHEFSELLEADEGISTNILSDRLKKLQDEGIIDSIPHPASKRRKLIYLTDKGKDLIHVMMDIAVWSNRWLPERSRIPPHLLEMMEGDLEGFKRGILAKLRQWERSVGLENAE